MYLIVNCGFGCLVWFVYLVVVLLLCLLFSFALWSGLIIVNSVVVVVMYLCAPVQMFGLSVFFIGLL